MSDIPRIVYTEIFEVIGEELKAKFVQYVYDHEDDPETRFEECVKYTLFETFFNDQVVDVIDIKNTFHRRKQLTKKNWCKSFISDLRGNKPTPVHDEVKMLMKAIDQKKNKESIIELFSTTDPNEYVELKIKELEKWAEDKETFVSQFPYLETKKKSQLEKGFMNDLLYIMSVYMVNSPDNRIEERPKQLIEVSPIFDVGGREKTSKGNLTHIGEQSTPALYDQYKLSNDKLLVSILKADEEGGDKIVLNKMTLLDSDDLSIIHTTLNSKSERFYKEKIVTIDIGELVKVVYPKSDSKKAYDLVTRRLKKIGRYYIEGKVLNVNKRDYYNDFQLNFFQSVQIIKDPATGRIYAEIMFSDFLHRQVVERETVQIYSHLIKKLENPVSRLLVYAFQKERMDSYLEERPMLKFFDYNFFHDRIRFRSKRVDSNLKTIQTSLQEFKDLQVLVMDFERINNGFNIDLLPITDDEKQDFFSESPFMIRG